MYKVYSQDSQVFNCMLVALTVLLTFDQVDYILDGAAFMLLIGLVALLYRE